MANNTAIQTATGGNNIVPTSTIVITLTADNASGTAALSTVNIFRGAGDTSLAALPSGVTVSGDYADWGNFHDFVDRVPMTVYGMDLQSADTANFGTRMYLWDNNPNKQNETKGVIDLVLYRQPTGNGYADSLSIPGEKLNFFVLPTTVLTLIIKKNTAIRLTIHVSAVMQTATVAPKNF